MGIKWITLKKSQLSLLVNLLLASIMLCGCYTKKQAVSKFCTPSQKELKDSIWILKSSLLKTHSRILDSVVYYPETILETIFLPCDTFGNLVDSQRIELRSGTGRLTIKPEAGGYKITSICDAMERRFRQELESKDSIIDHLQGSTHFEKEIPPVKKSEVLFWWVKPSLITLGIFAFPTVLWILFRLLGFRSRDFNFSRR